MTIDAWVNETLYPEWGQRFKNWQERHISKQNFIASVFDDEGYLLFKQSRVDRVANKARTRHAIIKLNVSPSVPGQRGHAVTFFDTHPL